MAQGAWRKTAPPVPFRLQLVERGVDAAGRQERRVAPFLDQAAAFQHLDAVRQAAGTQPMADQEDRAPLRRPGETLVDCRVSFGVQRRRRLIKHQQERQERDGRGGTQAAPRIHVV